MPNLTGSEFFRSIRHEHPNTMRLLLTGYADINSVIAAINSGEVFRYITKPWDPIELATIVREAFDKHWLTLQNRHLVANFAAQPNPRTARRTPHAGTGRGQSASPGAQRAEEPFPGHRCA